MSPFFAVILHHLLQLFHVLDDLLGPLTCSDVINSSKDQNFQPVGQVEIVLVAGMVTLSSSLHIGHI